MSYKTTRWFALCTVATAGMFWMTMAVPVRADDATSTPSTVPDTAMVPADATSTQGSDGTGSGIASVDTGSATASTDQQNTVNTTDASTTDTAHSSSATSTTENAADIGTQSSTTAETGQNVATGGSGAAVSSGGAVATANVINVANTNIYDSNGLILFLNQLFGGAPDLRTLDLSFFFGSGATSSCTFLSCGASNTVNVIDTNTATVTNELLVHAATGGNVASSTYGAASVASGDAFAAANLLNLVNTNIIDSNYLLVSFNNFGNMAGDITLPDADFFTQLLSRGSGSIDGNANSLSASTDNAVTIDGTTTADAQTGGNLASTTGTSSVGSGAAYSNASTFTQANSTQVGGTSVYMLFRVWGNWSGSVQGLPDGMTWRQTPNGIELVGANGGSGSSSLLGGASNTLAASTSNVASITNNVHVWALTGDNKATSDTGDARVSSGNAYAAANVMNLVNTTILGRNWIFAIFNIFGDWNGNIAFGHPDLWVGATAQAGDPASPGSTVTYRFTVANKGDADATDVILHAAVDTTRLAFDPGSLSGASSVSDKGASWNIGTVRKGETRDLEYRAIAQRVPGGAATPVTLTATLSSAQTDQNAADNTDQLAVAVGDPPPLTGGIGPGPWAIDPKVTIEKHASVAATVASTTVDYSVVIRNARDAGPAFLGKLSDEIVAPDGTKLYSKTWKLGTIAPGDEIRLSYTVAFGTSTPLGTYGGSATVTARKKNPVDLYAVDMPPVSASTSIEVLPRGNAIEVTMPTPTEASATVVSHVSQKSTTIASIKKPVKLAHKTVTRSVAKSAIQSKPTVADLPQPVIISTPTQRPTPLTERVSVWARGLLSAAAATF